MPNPKSGLAWARRKPSSELLRRLGRGEIELTHEAFHTLQPWRAASHLRELLMECAVLPKVDKHVCSFERWLGVFLPAIADPDHARVLRDGAPIPDLFAAGEMTGHFYATAPNAVSVLRAFVFGRIAGREAAENLTAR